MSWNLNGQYFESCSCAMSCRCALGPASPDQGWCSALQLVEVERGSSDGLDLGGARYAVALQLPGDFFSGIEKARMYFDEATTTEAQRQALVRIYAGEQGGVWGNLKDAIAEWLPPKVAAFEYLASDEGFQGTVGDVGRLKLAWLKTPDGKQAKLVNAPVVAAFEVAEVDLLSANGSGMTDPDLRGWESLGFGGRCEFDWSS